MEIDEDNFEHPGYYLFQCEVCHKQIEVLSKHEIERCLECQIVICKKCSTFGFCPKDFQGFSQEIQNNIIETETKQKKQTLIRQLIIWGISIPVSIELLMSYINGFQGAIGLIIMLLLFSGIILMLGTDIRRKTIKAKLNILENIQKEGLRRVLRIIIDNDQKKSDNQRMKENSKEIIMNNKESVKEKPERYLNLILKYPNVNHSELKKSDQFYNLNNQIVHPERVKEDISSFSIDSNSFNERFSH